MIKKVLSILFISLIFLQACSGRQISSTEITTQVIKNLENLQNSRLCEETIEQITYHYAIDTAPEWHPSMNWVSFIGYYENIDQVILMNPESLEPVQLTNNKLGNQMGGYSWSPDGSYLILTYLIPTSIDSGVTYGLFISSFEYLLSNPFNPESSITIDKIVNGFSPDWSSNDEILYISSQENEGAINNALFVWDLDTGETKQISPPELNVFGGRWSPDGNKIALNIEVEDTRYQIFIMNADGTGVTQLMDNEFSDISPVWSSDGKHLAFSSNRDGVSWNIYIYSFESGKVLQITNQMLNEIVADWNDYDELLFIANWGSNNPEWANEMLLVFPMATVDDEVYLMNLCLDN